MKKKKLKKKYYKILTVVLSLFIVIVLFFAFGGFLLKLDSNSLNKTNEIEFDTKDFTYPKVTCKYLGFNISKKIKRTNDIDVKKVGKQELKYTCKELTFKKEIAVKYDVVDKVPPVIKLNGKNDITLYVGDKFKDGGATATDNVDGDISKKVIVEGTVNTKKVGKAVITYTVTDSSGHKSVVKRKVTVKEKPKYYTPTGGSSNMSCGEAGVIYLTFDDGPNPYHTPTILNVLKKYGVKATFFVTMAGPDNLIKREYNEGHTVALHSASHDYAKIYKSSDAFWQDMATVSKRVERITGKKTMMFRFPGGASNTVSRHYSIGIMSQLAREADNTGYSYFDWNISSGDAGETTDPNQEYRNVVNSLSKTRGNVVLMHDIKEHTANAIESIVKYGKDNGYQFKVLTPDIVCHQGINN